MALRGTRPGQPPSGMMATDFVQDYATKRQAQLERARQIREERLQHQQPQNDGGSSSGPATASTLGAGARATASSPTTAPSFSSSSTVLQIREDDFKKATQTGIITPDQARQLWAMLSNQAVRVAGVSLNHYSGSGGHTASMDALMNLSTQFHSSGSSEGSRRGGGNGTGGSAGMAISLESLRHSIAQFKDEQRRAGARGGGGQAPTKRQASQPLAQAPSVHHRQNTYPHDDDHDYEDDRDSRGELEGEEPAEDPNAYFYREENATTSAGGGRGKSSKPEWNSDTVSPSGGSGGGRGDPGDRAPTNRRRAGDATSKRVTAAGGAGGKGRAPVKPAWDDGENEQEDSYEEPVRAPASRTQAHAGGPRQAQQQQQPARPSGSKAASPGSRKTGAGGVVRPSSSSSPSMPPPPARNFDDMPVGGGGGGFNVSPYASGEEMPVATAVPRRGGGGGRDCQLEVHSGAAPPSNEEIAAAAAAAASEPQHPCPVCGRSFRVSILPRHEKVCRQNENKKRKVFDIQGMRLDGVEGIQEVQRQSAPYAGRGGGGNRGAANNRRGNGNANANAGDVAGAGRLPKWKVQHEQFQAAMRAVAQQRAYEEHVKSGGGGGRGGVAPLMPPPPPAPAAPEYDDRVPCPHCGRKFAENVAERHIPKCANTVAKPKGIRPIRR